MKKPSKVNSDLLIAIYQNLLTARQSINNIIEKVHDSKLKKELDYQYKSYTPIKEACEKLAQKHKIDIVDNSFFEKARMWMSVNMSIMLDKSNRKISSVLIFGNTMGIIDLICVISDCKKGSKEFLDLAEELKNIETENIERAKPYLLKENNKPQKPASVKAENIAKQERNSDTDTKQPTPRDNSQESSNKVDL